MDSLQVMRREELLAELKKASDQLDDVRDEREFTLGQTGVHLGASRIASLRDSWDREEARLTEKIHEVKGLLEALE